MSVKKKSFGQHFLHDKGVIKKIADATGVERGDLVVEVGPGEGALTHMLCEREAELVLLEADRDLVPALREVFPDARVELGDAAKADFDALTEGRAWTFVGNLPYNAAGAIITAVLDAENVPEKMVVMVQKEHGDRMRAKPGEMGLLSVVVQLNATVKKLFDVGAGAFDPPPNVQSTVLQMTPLKNRLTKSERDAVIALAKAGFSSRRKQLQKNLSDAGIATAETVKNALEKIDLPSTARAQELSIKQWIELQKTVG